MRRKGIIYANFNIKRYFPYIIFVFCIFLVISIIRNVKTIKHAQKQVEEKRIELEELEAQNQILKDQENTISSEFYKETQLRDKLGYVKEGEIAVVLPSEEVLRKLAPDMPKKENEISEPNWRKWLKLFF